MTKHFLTLSDFEASTLEGLIDRAIATKKMDKKDLFRKEFRHLVIGLFFEKPSTRTRFSFEVAVHQLGAKAVFINASEVGLGKREPIRDVSRVLSRYFDAVMFRANSHEDVEQFSQYASIPVINGLTDYCHPCQALADLVTIKERGYALNDFTLCYIGDGNNVCQSLIHASEKFGFNLVISCPEAYEPKIPNVSTISIESDPFKAVKGADFIYTDVWTSMGQEDEYKSRLEAFQAYQVNDALLEATGKTSYFLHCLPAHRDEEVTDSVVESSSSLVFDQAENRLHAQRALLEFIWEGQL